ncbi:TSUP family transporter [Microbacterium sp. ASV81]|uniref:Probable membrane transporter protein n=1 Tax=Microbacterium capsulatum TaxID=3041921 RepID=A0ABU0XF13_9MICO|nr:TSUP family transporter [Microbacterium sp. ASV81]MDQ4213704.1 TSUP family transporter [Microbacterium sp. ASV81]
MEWLGVGVLVAVAAGATVQIITGTGFALVCAPFLLLLLGHDVGVRAVLVLSLALNAYLLAITIRHVRWRDSLLLLLPAALVVVPTVFVVGAIRGPALTITAGAVMVIATLLVVRGRRLKMIDTPGGVVLVGAVSGVFTVVAAVSGPPVTLLAVQRKWSPDVTRGTMQAFFLPLNLFALLLLGPVDADLSKVWWAVGGCVLGLLAGSLGARRLPAPAVRWAMLTVAAAGGAWLTASGVWEVISTAARGSHSP